MFLDFREVPLGMFRMLGKFMGGGGGCQPIDIVMSIVSIRAGFVKNHISYNNHTLCNA